MRKTILLLLFAIPSFLLQAQEPLTLSLQEAIDYALEHNVSLRNAQIEIADAEEQIIERRSFGLPKLNGSVGYNYFFQLPKSLIPATFIDPNAPDGEFAELQFGTANDLTLKLEATSMIFDGSYFVGLRAARAFRSYVEKDLNSKRRDVENGVVETYLPALLLQRTKETLAKNLTTLDKLLNETTELYKAGFVEQLDVDRLELSIANLKTEQTNIDRQMDLIYNALKFQMGYPMDQEIVIADEIESLLIPATNDELTAEVDYNTRPEYQVLMMGRRLNELNVELNKASYLPSLGAFASYQQSAQGDNLFKNPFWIPTGVVGLSLNVPIFDGFEKKAKVNRAKLDLEIVDNQRKDLERAIKLEVANARVSYSAAQSRLDDQRKNLNLAEKIFSTTQIKYKEGVGSSLELVQAEQSLFQTQQNYIQSIYDLLLAKTNLNKALGK